MVSRYLKKPVSVAEFHHLTHAGDLGVCAFTDLLNVLRQHGFSAEAVCYQRNQPPRHRLPMILFVDSNHFLVAIPGTARRVCIVNPPNDPRLMTWDQLSTRWDGAAIIVGLDEAAVKAALGRDRS